MIKDYKMVSTFEAYKQLYENKVNIDHIIDFTVIKPNLREEDVLNACEIAKEKKYQAVCTLPEFIDEAKIGLEDSNVDLCIFLDYRKEVMKTINRNLDSVLSKGVDEIDLLLNLKKVKKLDDMQLTEDEEYENEYNAFSLMLNSISSRCRREGVVLKLIIEIGELTIGQIKIYCSLAKDAEIEFLQTSSGMYQNGSDINKIKLMKKFLPDRIKIKVAGGIHNMETAIKFTKLVDRIGTSRII